MRTCSELEIKRLICRQFHRSLAIAVPSRRGTIRPFCGKIARFSLSLVQRDTNAPHRAPDETVRRLEGGPKATSSGVPRNMKAPRSTSSTFSATSPSARSSAATCPAPRCSRRLPIETGSTGTATARSTGCTIEGSDELAAPKWDTHWVCSPRSVALPIFRQLAPGSLGAAGRARAKQRAQPVPQRERGGRSPAARLTLSRPGDPVYILKRRPIR